MNDTGSFLRRVSELNDAPVRSGSYVLYWMQQSQRATCNHALEYAVRLADERNLPVLVVFGLTADYPEACARHYRFMLEGLQETRDALRERGIAFVLRIAHPPEAALELGRKAAAIVCDRGYLAHLRQWRYAVAREAKCRVVEVESDLVVPVEEASSKQEYAARTIRSKLHRRLGEFLVPLEATGPRCAFAADGPRGASLDDLDELMKVLSPAAEPAAVSRFFTGGYRRARARLERFAAVSLPEYESSRSEPGLDVGSGLSPYLHFGQISSLEIALSVGGAKFVEGLASGGAKMSYARGSVGMRTSSDAPASARDAFLEELLVRRELAHNYVWYARGYDRYEALPQWARSSLEEHAADPREYRYSDEQLFAAGTHDRHWNNAMRQMRETGFMHNYMRMYWGKKILEWTDDPEQAYSRTLRLNNRWFLDGRDANSYANVGWVYGLHDRPWTERAIFGKVRYMNAAGLERKFAMDRYQEKVDRLCAQAREAGRNGS